MCDSIEKVNDIMRSVYKITNINNLKFTISIHGKLLYDYFDHNSDVSLENDNNLVLK